jgi:hypothetical protein
MELSSIASGVSSSTIVEVLKRWLPIGNTPESSIDVQAEALIEVLDDDMETTEDLKQSLNKAGGFTIEREYNSEGVINKNKNERKEVDFDISADRDSS